MPKSPLYMQDSILKNMSFTEWQTSSEIAIKVSLSTSAVIVCLMDLSDKNLIEEAYDKINKKNVYKRRNLE